MTKQTTPIDRKYTIAQQLAMRSDVALAEGRFDEAAKLGAAAEKAREAESQRRHQRDFSIER